MESALLKSYLIRQLQTASEQLPLVGPAADIEALHRFRVALRRFRSVLSAYTHHLYAPDAIAKSMLKVTNPLRETDVFLDALSSESYPNLHAALTRYREKQYKKRWPPETPRRFAQTIDLLIADVQALKLDQRKGRLIRRGEAIYEKAKTARRALGEDSKEEEIHEIRLRYKQARYVLEFLDEAGLVDAKRKIKNAKKHLEHFGAIQDAANQLAWLHRFCDKHPSQECAALYEARKKALRKLKKAFEL
ncbi:CHAD domain-containing protein [Sulfurimonas diazotrophicus]|uniref:CHAD domain-containing protein n=1 Tax=Sulfurimonas diazotrophicus TaxID=3131939 RepID=A0ABZ3HC39_9BACT